MRLDLRAPSPLALSLALTCSVGLACADPATSADSPETGDETLGDGDGDPTGDGDGNPTGDGDGDPTGDGDGEDDPTTGGPECQTDNDCQGTDYCFNGSCYPYEDPCPGDCSECSDDSDCELGYCKDGFECVPVDVLDTCAGDGPNLTALTLPAGVADLSALALTFGDVDGDGDDDLLVAHADGLTVVRNDQLVVSALGPWQPNAIAAWTRDAGGQLDLAVWTEQLQVFDGDGQGGFAGQVDVAGELEGFADLARLARLDVDGDDDDDLIAHNGSAALIWWNEAGVLTPLPGPTLGPHDVAIGDFGDDGRDELVSGDDALGLDVFAFVGGGRGWTVDGLNGLYSGSFDGIATARLPGDADLGFVAVDRRTSGDLALLEVYRGQPGWPDEAESLVQLPARYARVAAGDFDGDGADTVVAYAEADGGAARLLEFAGALDDYCHADAGLPATEQVAIGDLDGDGDDELALISADGKVLLFGAP